jgi:hypothetical protein
LKTESPIGFVWQNHYFVFFYHSRGAMFPAAMGLPPDKVIITRLVCYGAFARIVWTGCKWLMAGELADF